jgi:hypothetical protein
MFEIIIVLDYVIWKHFLKFQKKNNENICYNFSSVLSTIWSSFDFHMFS